MSWSPSQASTGCSWGFSLSTEAELIFINPSLKFPPTGTFHLCSVPRITLTELLSTKQFLFGLMASFEIYDSMRGDQLVQVYPRQVPEVPCPRNSWVPSKPEHLVAADLHYIQEQIETQRGEREDKAHPVRRECFGGKPGMEPYISPASWCCPNRQQGKRQGKSQGNSSLATALLWILGPAPLASICLLICGKGVTVPVLR